MSADIAPGLERLNTLPPDEAQRAFLRCCGSSRWATAMTTRRPYASCVALLEAADAAWAALDRDDHLEAFAHHPRIGGADLGSKRFDATRTWSRGEQAGMDAAPDDVRAAITAGNDAYFERFGYVFLICAAGTPAETMLEQLTIRLENDPDTELGIAAEEQHRIARLRLEKLVG